MTVVEFPLLPFQMKTIASLLVLLTALAPLGGCKRPAEIEAPNGDAASAAAFIQNGLKLSIPVPVSSGIGKREIFLHPLELPHFHVLLTNTSQKSINIWKDWCSLGYRALSFEFTTKRGNPWKVQRNPNALYAHIGPAFELTDKEGNTLTVQRNPNIIYAHNGPAYWTIAPHENVVLDIDLADSKTWQGIRWPGESRFPSDGPLHLKIRAFYEVAPTKESRELSVWTGRIMSEANDYMIYM
jgi:hypothetical protein